MFRALRSARGLNLLHVSQWLSLPSAQRACGVSAYFFGLAAPFRRVYHSALDL